MGVSFDARLDALEARLLDAERDQEFDAVEPDLKQLRLDVWETLRSEEAQLGRARTEYQKRFHWWDYVFDPEARDRWATTVSRKQYELEHEKSVEYRLARLLERFYADKTRAHAREFIRIAEKVQREVHADWPVKAGAAFGGAIAERSADDAIAMAKEVGRALAGRYVDEGLAIAAALIGGLAPDTAAARLREISDDLGNGERAGRILGATLLGVEPPSDQDRDDAARRFPEFEPPIALSLALSGRDPEDARALISATRGGGDAQNTLVAAGLLAQRPLEESVAFIRHVQQQLTGTWESEALIIAGGILAGDRSDARTKALFTIPELFVVTED